MWTWQKKEGIFNEWIGCLIGLVWLKTKLDRERNVGKKKKIRRASETCETGNTWAKQRYASPLQCWNNDPSLHLEPTPTSPPLSVSHSPSSEVFLFSYIAIFFVVPPSVSWQPTSSLARRRKRWKRSHGWLKSFACKVSVDVALTAGLQFVTRPHITFFLWLFVVFSFFSRADLESTVCNLDVGSQCLRRRTFALPAAANVAKPTIVVLSCRINSDSGEHRP